MRKRIFSAALALSLALSLCLSVPALGAQDMSLTSLTDGMYDDMGYFSEGLISARMGNEHYYLDTTGVAVIGPFTAADYFPNASEGANLFTLGFSQGLAGLVANYQEGSEWKTEALYIDKTGAVKIRLDTEHLYNISGFNEGSAVAELEDGSKLLIGLDGSRSQIAGNIVSTFTVSEGLFVAEGESGLLGYSDKNGVFSIPAIYSEAYPFCDGYAVVMENSLYGVIDKSGKYILKDFQGFAFSGITGRVFLGGLAMAAQGGQWGLVNTAGTPVGGFKWSGIGRWNDRVFVVYDGSAIGLIDSAGATVLAPQYLHIAPVTEQYAAAMTGDGSYVLIDTTGARVSSQSFSIEELESGFDQKTDKLLPAALYVSSSQYGLCSVAVGAAPSDWSADHIDRAIELGLVPESLRSDFGAPASRSEFCALGVALYETVMGHAIEERKDFTDTDDENIMKMGALDVVIGVGGGKFDPASTITREQAAIMLSNLMRALDEPLDRHTSTFDDSASISSWALAQVGQVQGAGIMAGIGDNLFAPKRTYTREESIITILKLYDLVTQQ